MHFATHVSHDPDEPSHDHPACPLQSGADTVECKVDVAEEKTQIRTTVSFECDPLCDGATEVKQDSPGVSKGKNPPSLAVQSPSPNIKKKVSTSESSSPRVKKLSQEGPKGIASPTKSSTPILKKSGSLSGESQSPKKKENASSLTEVTSSASSPSGKERKSGKRRKKDGAARKERKRGLSSSSSDDPKVSRSRTESAGSETLDVVDQGVIAGEGTADGREDGMGIVSEAFSTGQEGSDSTPQYLTTPTETPSPSVKIKTSSRKKRGGSESRKKRHGSKRERGLSSSSDDPKSSRSRTVSLGSEVPPPPVAPSKDPTAVYLDVLEDAVTTAEGDDSCFAPAPCNICRTGSDEPPPPECRISVTDYDFSEC